jgi:hypothetical protein
VVGSARRFGSMRMAAMAAMMSFVFMMSRGGNVGGKFNDPLRLGARV